MLPHPLSSFEIQRFYDLPKNKFGAYAKNLNKCKSIGTHCVAIYVKNDKQNIF